MFSVTDVSRIISNARITKNLTQMDATDALGINCQAVSNWERGKRAVESYGRMSEKALKNVGLCCEGGCRVLPGRGILEEFEVDEGN